MTQVGWEKVIKGLSDKPEMIILLAKYLCEIDEAKQILCEKGYRVTGQPLLHVVKTLPHYEMD